MKFPRTFHLPFSECLSSDDKYIEDIAIFKSQEIVVTEKMDGENFSLYHNKVHARSLDSKHHESRSWIKGFHAQFKHSIPNNLQIVGENLFAKHSIYYDKLPSYFLVFSIIQNDKFIYSWDDILHICDILGLAHVPVLYRGYWDDDIIKNCFRTNSFYGAEQEGYVIRLTKQIDVIDWPKEAAKFVRKNHIQSNEHWMQQKIIKNAISQVN